MNNNSHEARGLGGREIIEAALGVVFGHDQGSIEVINIVEETSKCTFFMRRSDGSTFGPIPVDYSRANHGGIRSRVLGYNFQADC